MSVTNNRPKNDIGVYLCGGTGADVAAVLAKELASILNCDRAEEALDDGDNLGNIKPYLIDTSTSNLTSAHDGIPFYHLKQNGQQMDGGGKIMNGVYKAAVAASPDIIKEMPPGRFNIVFGNLGGGSGSGTTVAITRELIEQGCNVVVVGIAASESKAVLDNTNRSITLLQNVADKYSKSVLLAPFFAEGTESFSQVNSLIVQNILMLASLFSNRNARLDTADLVNWMNPDVPLDVEPALVGLYLTTGTAELPKGIVPLTVATLTATADEAAATGWHTEYQAHGILPAGTNSRIFVKLPAHFSVCDGIVNAIHDLTMERSQEIKRALENRPKRQALNTRGVDLGDMDV